MLATSQSRSLLAAFASIETSGCGVGGRHRSLLLRPPPLLGMYSV